MADKVFHRVIPAFNTIHRWGLKMLSPEAFRHNSCGARRGGLLI